MPSGVQLEGSEAAKYTSLADRLASEQQEYLRQLRAKAFSDHRRYTHCTAEASQQLEVGTLTVIQQHLSHWVRITGGTVKIHNDTNVFKKKHQLSSVESKVGKGVKPPVMEDFLPVGAIKSVWTSCA